MGASSLWRRPGTRAQWKPNVTHDAVAVLGNIKKGTPNKGSWAPYRGNSVKSVWAHQVAGASPAKINGYTFLQKRQSPASKRKARTMLHVSKESPKQDGKPKKQ